MIVTPLDLKISVLSFCVCGAWAFQRGRLKLPIISGAKIVNGIAVDSGRKVFDAIVAVVLN